MNWGSSAYNGHISEMELTWAQSMSKPANPRSPARGSEGLMTQNEAGWPPDYLLGLSVPFLLEFFFFFFVKNWMLGLVESQRVWKLDSLPGNRWWLLLLTSALYWLQTSWLLFAFVNLTGYSSTLQMVVFVSVKYKYNKLAWKTNDFFVLR